MNKTHEIDPVEMNQAAAFVLNKLYARRRNSVTHTSNQRFQPANRPNHRLKKWELECIDVIEKAFGKKETPKGEQ